MTAFLSDTMTDTPGTTIVSHTPDVGGAYTALGTNSATISAAGRCYPDSAVSADCAYSNAATPPSADYYAEAVFRRLSSNATQYGFLYIRGSSNPETGDSYRMQLDVGGGGDITLHKFVSGSPTALGSPYSTGAWSVGDEHTIRIGGTGTGIYVNVDGIQRIGVTDGAITAAGNIALRLLSADGSSTAGLHMDLLTGDVLGGAPPSLSEDSYSFPMQVTPQRRTVMVSS